MEDGRGRKLLSNLKVAFSRDPHIDEYDFLPVLEPTNNCNPLILTQHKLGVELWAAKLLYYHAYNTLLTWRQHRQHSLDGTDIETLTRAIVLMNADCATAWNIRKENINQGILSSHDDLKLGALVLTKHPKSPETFAHRKWVLSKLKERILPKTGAINPENLSTHSSNAANHDIAANQKPGQRSQEDCKTNQKPGQRSQDCLPSSHQQCQVPMIAAVKELVEGEMYVCQHAAEKYANNYNAWTHRLWVLNEFSKFDLDFLRKELEASGDWVAVHVSDHSGFHYRQYLLNAMLACPSPDLDLVTLLRSEVEMVADLILTFPGHEAVWYHRRYIVDRLCHLVEKSQVTTVKSLDKQAKRSRVDLSRDSLLEQERNFCGQAKPNNQLSWQHTLANRHMAWIDRKYSV